jgi:hypothetical protein
MRVDLYKITAISYKRQKESGTRINCGTAITFL